LEEIGADSSRKAKLLLGRDDPSPVNVVNKGGSSPYLLLGDHAGRAIPAALGDLGLPAEALERHIACDIGVAALGLRLSQALDATFVHQSYSRLVVDCNRKPSAADFIAKLSDGQVIPGNAELTTPQRTQRRREIFAPYHTRISGALIAREQQAMPTVLVSLHSFTPVMDGFARPWRYGVLHRGDSALSRSVLALLSVRFGEAAGDNQPYAMDTVDYTIPFHADARGLDYLELEVRQDLLTDGAAQDEVAAIIGEVLKAALSGSGASGA
jgi:predicted N-formylglutamate amidohydrolase